MLKSSRETLNYGLLVNGLVFKALDSQSGVPKPLGGFKVDSTFHHSEVDQVSTTNFWELSGKKYAVSSKWLCSLEEIKGALKF